MVTGRACIVLVQTRKYNEKTGPERSRVFVIDQATFVVNLQHPIAMDNGACFAICEGNLTVGAGQVMEILG
jgi:translation elongation factor EF-Tu-like GTPase